MERAISWVAPALCLIVSEVRRVDEIDLPELTSIQCGNDACVFGRKDNTLIMRSVFDWMA